VNGLKTNGCADEVVKIYVDEWVHDRIHWLVNG
jgi:hypothetical protein